VSNAEGNNTNDPKTLRERAVVLLAKDFFSALGLARTATTEDVQKAFIEAAKTWHPDRAPAGNEDLKVLFAKVFARIDLARTTLMDSSQRARYIETLNRADEATAEVTIAEAALELKKSDAMLKKNDRVQAGHHLERALKLEPSNVEIAAAMISLQFSKPTTSREELRRALQVLDQLGARDQTCERAYMTRAVIRKRLDMQKEAYADFTKVANLNPNNIDAAREVRLFKMRNETPQQRVERIRSEEQQQTTTDPPPSSRRGVGGFFKKLFKR